MIFLRCGPSRIIRFKTIRMIQNILTIQIFHIIVQVHRITAILTDIIELIPIQRHCGNTALIWLFPLSIVSLFSAPDFRSRSRPPIRNVCSVFCGNPQLGHFVPTIMPTPIKISFGFEILYRILIPGVINIDHR